MHFQVIRVLQDIQSNRWHLLRTIPRFLEKDRERKICWKRDMFAPYRNSENQNAPNRLENEHDWTPSYIFACSMIRKKKSKHVINVVIYRVKKISSVLIPFAPKKINKSTNPSLSWPCLHYDRSFRNDNSNREIDAPGLSLDLWSDIPYLGGMGRIGGDCWSCGTRRCP